MQLRLALAACVVVACTMCGQAFAATAERRCRLLSGLLSALRMLRIEIGSMLEPLQSALARTGLPLLTLTAERLAEEGSVADAWQTVRAKECARGGSADSLTERDLLAVDRLFEHLGESGRETQEEDLRSCIASVEVSLAEAKERAAQVGRLYTSLGFLAGLALAVLMI